MQKCKQVPRLVAALALVMTLATAAAAQTPPARPGMGQGMAAPNGVIRGTVVDSATARPLRNVGVAVRSERDSALVAGALTAEDGSFRIEGLRPGRYRVRISIVGFEPRVLGPVTLLPAEPVRDLGTVRLGVGAGIQLEGLSVTAERRTDVTMAADRNIYVADNLPASASGNASDVLGGVPAVEVDGDGNISLRGNPNVVVQINGRPMALRGDALANFLKQLPASMVETVEVVPNPSAKYDPAGMGGIVNIVLKKNADLGLSGSATVSAGTRGRYSANGSLGYGRGPLTLSGSYGFNQDTRESSGTNFRINRYLDPVTRLNQVTDGERDFTSHSLNGAAALRVGERDELSAALLLGVRDGSAWSEDDYLLLDALEVETARYGRVTEGSGSGVVSDVTLGWKRTFRPRIHELSTEVRFNGNTDDDADVQRPAGSVVAVPFATQLQNVASDSRVNSWTLQADYVRPFFAGTKLETGFKGTLRNLSTDYGLELSSVGDSTPVRRTAYTFDYGEQVAAVYGLLGRRFGDVDAQAGVRLERTGTRFDLTTTGEAFDNNYFSAFPSAAVGYEWGDARQLRASYSRRIERPNTRLLNPFPRIQDPLNRFVGNPAVRPEYTDAFELGFLQSLDWGTLQVNPFYRHTTDVVRRFRSIDSLGVSTTTFLNLDNASTYGADFTASARFGDRFNGFASTSVYRAVTTGDNVREGLASDAVTWSARVNGTAKLNPSLDLQFFQYYRAPTRTEQGRIGSFSRADVSLRQRLLADRASLTLRLGDPFDQSGFSFLTDEPDLYQETTRRFGGRTLYLSFNYSFGKQPRLRTPRQRGTEQNEPDIDMP